MRKLFPKELLVEFSPAAYFDYFQIMSPLHSPLLAPASAFPVAFRFCSFPRGPARQAIRTAHNQAEEGELHCCDSLRRQFLTASLLKACTAAIFLQPLPSLRIDEGQLQYPPSPQPLQAVEGSERRGMGRYIKKKKLDPLDTYVPAVIAAKNQLQRAGGIMKDNLQGARELLRNGAFDGLRDNIRAIGEYAVQEGNQDAKKLPDRFFQSVEGFDFTLFQAKRNESPVGAESETALKTAVSSIDSLLATVPQNILDDSAKIVEAVEGSFQAQPAVPKEGSDKQLDQLMQLVPTQAN